MASLNQGTGKPAPIVLLCRVIDNHGDAGFCLRLARGLLAKRSPSLAFTLKTSSPNNHNIRIICDQPDKMLRLAGPSLSAELSVEPWSTAELPEPGSQLIECFQCGLPDQWSVDELVNRLSDWTVIDYLCTEFWGGSCNNLLSPEPGTGFPRRFLVPGFLPDTAGLLHPIDQTSAPEPGPAIDGQTRDRCKVLLFCYPSAPLNNLLHAWQRLHNDQTLKSLQPEVDISLCEARLHGISQANSPLSSVKCLPWLTQEMFDEKLSQSDWCFVRGEDSFVQAQWAGKPLIWQIYPTDDDAHWRKLEAFFEHYAAGLADAPRRALWQFWLSWNGGQETNADRLLEQWLALQAYDAHYRQHATAWQQRLYKLPKLIDAWKCYLFDQL